MLTQEQIKLRAGKLTASRVGILMSGNEAKIYDLWREVCGDPEYVAPDLSRIWPVQLGSHTEVLNLDWYALKRGVEVTRRGEVVIHPKFDWAAATLDGWDDSECVPIETKHVGGREPLDRILARYCAQFHWQMIVTETKYLFASIIEAANEPLIERIEFDHDYAAELWQRAVKFMGHVETLTAPVPMPAVVSPVSADILYDMTGRNEWADSAVVWLDTYVASKKAIAAEKALKILVPSDAKVCRGHGVEVSRDRAMRLSLRVAA